MKVDYKAGIMGACVFLGAIIGAGFATGQEIYRFFAFYGLSGMLGILICGLLLFFVCRAAFGLSAIYKEKNYFRFLRHFLGDTGAGFYHMVTTAFLFVVFGVMGTGMASGFSQAYGMHRWVGFLLFLACMYIFSQEGEKGVLYVNTVLTPVMIAGLLLICIYVLTTKDVSAFAKLNFQPFGTQWLMASFLYCGYNSLGALPVITNLHNTVKNQKTANFSAIICAGVFSVCVLIIYFTLSGFFGIIKGLEIPILQLASYLGQNFSLIYFIILMCSILTTGVSCIFALNKNLNGMKHSSLFIILAALPFGFADFSFLVKNFYAFFGVLGFILCLVMIVCYKKG